MNLKSSLVTLLVIIIWGSNFIAIKVGIAELPPLALLTLRFTLTGLLFLPLMKWPGWNKALWIAATGVVVGLLHQGFLYAGLMHMPAGMMSIILQSQVIIVTLIGLLFLKETIGWRTWAGITVGILGIIILVGAPTEGATPLGYVFGFLSALFVAFTYMMMKHISKVHAPTYIALMNMPVAPLIFGSSLLFEGTEWMHTYSDINFFNLGCVILYQSVIVAFSHMIWQKLVAENPVSQIAPWTLLLPLFSVIMAALFLGESITLAVILGGLLTVMGVAIITFRKIQKGTPPKVEAFD